MRSIYQIIIRLNGIIKQSLERICSSFQMLGIMILIFCMLGNIHSIENDDGKEKSQVDLSAEKNFFRFKEEIKHSLPGESFFRINFNTNPFRIRDYNKEKKSRQINHVKPREASIKSSKVQNVDSKVMEKGIEQREISIPYLPKTPSKEATTKVETQTKSKAETKYQPASSTEYVINENDRQSLTSTMGYPSSSPRAVGGFSY